MLKKFLKPEVDRTPQVPTDPVWETRSRKPLVDGRVWGVDGSLWMYRRVPLAAIVDAKTEQDAINAGDGLQNAFEGLAELADAGINRTVSQKSYREFHALLVNTPTYYQAPESSPIRGYLNREFYNKIVLRRELVFGVKLIPRLKATGLRDAFESLAYSATHGGIPLADFAEDTQDMSDALSRAGFTVPDGELLRFVDSWWDHGIRKSIPVVPHSDHLHFFQKTSALHTLDEYYGLESCTRWPDVGEPEYVPGENAITFVAVNDFTGGFTQHTDPSLRWVPDLLDRGARVVSIRGRVEPQKVTRAQLKSQKSKITRDAEAFEEKGKRVREEQREGAGMLEELENSYARGEAASTLIDCSIIVGFDGVVDDVRKISPPNLELDELTDLQAAAWYETMICSNVRANPHQHDLISPLVSYSGLPNLSIVGDRDGALIGFTEADSQPVYLSAAAASAGDAAPLLLVPGATGSGKSVLLQWLNHQWGMSKIPCVVIDPKQKSDFAPAVEASGGSVVSLDEFVNQDGPLDPIRFSPDVNLGVQIAADMIVRVRPLSSAEMDRYETSIANALRHGVSQGASASGEALMFAARDGIIPQEVVDEIVGFAKTYPMFRATFGLGGGTSPLRVGDGITLIKVGNTQFDYPSAKSTDVRLESPSVRTSVNVLRMIVRASVMNLAGRGGVLNIDEEWIYEKSAPEELEQLGRLARSQNVLVALYTQTPSGPIELGLTGYFSRGLIGHLKDGAEASAAMDLFRSTNQDLLHRVQTDAFHQGSPQWSSLKALWREHDDGSRTLLRPAVFLHADLQGNFAPVVVEIPESFFKLASTNPDDLRARDAELASADED